MSDLAVFKVGLGDGVTKPARRMGQGVDALARSFQRLESASERAGKAAAVGTGKSRRAPGQGRQRSPRSGKGKAADLGWGGFFKKGPSPFKELTSDLKSMGVAAAITAGVVGGVLAAKVYNLAQLAGSSRLAFANMFGSEKEGNVQLEHSIDLANKFGLGLGETIGQVQKFTSLGFTPEQSDSLIAMGADMRALGRSTEEVNRIFLQLGQISAKGKLQGEELIVLAENGVNLGAVYDNLGRKLHKSREEIIAMQGKGELKSGTALNAIAETILQTVGKSKLGQAGEETAAKTVDGVVQKIGTRLETGLFKAVQKSEPGLVRGLNAVLNGLVGVKGDGIETTVSGFLDDIGRALERIGPQLPGLAKNFSEAFGQASGFKATNIESFGNALPGIATDLGTIAGHFASIVSWAAKLAKYGEFFSFMGPGLGGQGNPGSGSPAAKAFQGNSAVDPMLKYGAVGDAAKGMGWEDSKKKFQGNGYDLGANVSTGIAYGMSDNMSIATSAAQQLAAGVDSASRQQLDIHSPSGVFYDQGAMNDEGLAFGMYDNADVSIASARSVANRTVDASARALTSQSNGYGAITGAAAAAVSGGSGGAGGRSISIQIGDIVIQGQPDPANAGKAVLQSLELELANLLERHMQGNGAS